MKGREEIWGFLELQGGSEKYRKYYLSFYPQFPSLCFPICYLSPLQKVKVQKNSLIKELFKINILVISVMYLVMPSVLTCTEGID